MTGATFALASSPPASAMPPGPSACAVLSVMVAFVERHRQFARFEFDPARLGGRGPGARAPGDRHVFARREAGDRPRGTPGEDVHRALVRRPAAGARPRDRLGRVRAQLDFAHLQLGAGARRDGVDGARGSGAAGGAAAAFRVGDVAGEGDALEADPVRIDRAASRLSSRFAGVAGGARFVAFKRDVRECERARRVDRAPVRARRCLFRATVRIGAVVGEHGVAQGEARAFVVHPATLDLFAAGLHDEPFTDLESREQHRRAFAADREHAAFAVAAHGARFGPRAVDRQRLGDLQFSARKRDRPRRHDDRFARGGCRDRRAQRPGAGVGRARDGDRAGPCDGGRQRRQRRRQRKRDRQAHTPVHVPTIMAPALSR